VAVVLGLVAGRRTGLTSDTTAADSASAKVRRVLPKALAGRLEALLSSAGFTAPPHAATPPGTSVLLVLAEGARSRQPVTITYTAWRGGESERTLEPYGLVFHSARWYVTGADSLRGEVRTFRMDRITSAVLAPGTFEVPTDFDPAARVLAGLADVQYPHEVSVILHAPLTTIREQLPTSVATLTEVPGGVRMLLRANRLSWAAGMIAWLGCPFTVEYPDELRAELQALATRLSTCAAAGAAEG
jgi:predicted DNA-binding transcriptional regulator YafY